MSWWTRKSLYMNHWKLMCRSNLQIKQYVGLYCKGIWQQEYDTLLQLCRALVRLQPGYYERASPSTPHPSLRKNILAKQELQLQIDSWERDMGYNLDPVSIKTWRIMRGPCIPTGLDRLDRGNMSLFAGMPRIRSHSHKKRGGIPFSQRGMNYWKSLPYTAEEARSLNISEAEIKTERDGKTQQDRLNQHFRSGTLHPNERTVGVGSRERYGVMAEQRESLWWGEIMGPLK